ncbi:MAG: hypothetical protein KKG59_04965 [Nanoarchaeota archaeon]|nr:hypothetical protein [Nanoarchaeota archaeon]
MDVTKRRFFILFVWIVGSIFVFLASILNYSYCTNCFTSCTGHQLEHCIEFIPWSLIASLFWPIAGLLGFFTGFYGILSIVTTIAADIGFIVSATKFPKIVDKFKNPKIFYIIVGVILLICSYFIGLTLRFSIGYILS